MKKSGQRPYDDDILILAVDSIGTSVDYYHEDFIDVIRDKLWNKATDMFSAG